MANYTRWLRDGTIAVTQGSKDVTGTLTKWATANINPGDILKINGVDYEINAVNDDTHLSLVTEYEGETAEGQEYAIIRNFTSTSSAKVAALAAEILTDFSGHSTSGSGSSGGSSNDGSDGSSGSTGKDGKSAYDIWLEAGNTGTVADFLASLKGEKGDTGEKGEKGDKGDTGDSGSSGAVEVLSYNNAGAHNAIYRGKNLGDTLTEAQAAAIAAGTFDDLYIGDFWVINKVTYRIADFDYFGGSKHHIVIVPDTCLYNSALGWQSDTDVANGQDYRVSEAYSSLLTQAKTIITAAFGTAHIGIHEEKYNATKKLIQVSPDVDVALMNVEMLFGLSYTLDGNNNTLNQLNLFRYRPDLYRLRRNYWLINVTETSDNYGVTKVAIVSSTNRLDSSSIIESNGVRPYFMLI